MIIIENDLECSTIYHSPEEGYVTNWSGSFVFQAENESDVADVADHEWLYNFISYNCWVFCDWYRYRITEDNGRYTVTITDAG